MADLNVKEISLIPEIPQGLRESHLINGKIIPFIGAGISRLVGCPTWSEFADICLQFFVDNKQLNYGEIEQLKYLSPRIKLSLAMQLNKQSQDKIDFEKILRPKEQNSESLGWEAYNAIQAIANTFVTTNYDPCLRRKQSMGVMRAGDPVNKIAEPFERRIIYKKEDFRADQLSSADTVIHLHGSAHDYNSMIITANDYAEHYARDRIGDENPVPTFLTHLFSQKTALFLGYGLEELEILQYICNSQTRSQVRKSKHYLLQGFLSYELPLANHMYSYYQDLGIELIPYARDEHDWWQVAHVLKEFAKQIPAQPILPIEIRSEMGRLLDNE